MFDHILRISIHKGWFVLTGVIVMAMLGVYSYQRLPIDAVPDITNVQVQINTQAAGYSPMEAEQRVTFPIERVMAGLPNLESRSRRSPPGSESCGSPADREGDRGSSAPGDSLPHRPRAPELSLRPNTGKKIKMINLIKIPV